ncbi:MAG TPA: plasmid mobilization relaxosome protein MobC, partial [Chitinophaga sp.]|uniref:plasmid mobilization protein n=1 Tax=Chitinophaga sp. TaxID=1869181 RepID=UPI002B848E17
PEKKKGRGGRPVKAVRKEIRTGVRLTKAEYFIVKEKARIADLRYTVYIRQMALHGQVNARLNHEERAYIRQLINIGTNLNQIAKTAHKEGILSAMLLFENYRSQIDDLLNRLKR